MTASDASPDTSGCAIVRRHIHLELEEPAVSTSSTAAIPPPKLAHAYEAIRADAMRLAGGPGDMPPRVALLHAIFEDSRGNHAFPEVALHGALWAYGFYERRGTVSRAIAYRYFYDRDERSRRSYMLYEFSQGFKEANRSVFIDTYANYVFTRAYGEAPGADAIVTPELLEQLNRVHHAARAGRTLPAAERARVFESALLHEQERTVGPKIREEVGKFDCPILSAIVLRPVVRFSYFPRTTYMAFANFGATEERIEKAVRSYELAERAGWRRVGDDIRLHGVLPQRFFESPARYAGELADAAGAEGLHSFQGQGSLRASTV
jgi:hypothetical protein